MHCIDCVLFRDHHIISVKINQFEADCLDALTRKVFRQDPDLTDEQKASLYCLYTQLLACQIDRLFTEEGLQFLNAACLRCNTEATEHQLKTPQKKSASPCNVPQGGWHRGFERSVWTGGEGGKAVLLGFPGLSSLGFTPALLQAMSEMQDLIKSRCRSCLEAHSVKIPGKLLSI